MSMRILALTLYGPLGASSRVRFHLYKEYLSSQGVEIIFSPLVSDHMLQSRYQTGRYSYLSLIRSYLIRFLTLLKRSNYDLIWVEKEAFPWLPYKFDFYMLTGVPFVLDYDDATFHKYDSSPSRLTKFILGAKLSKLISKTFAVFVGNDYLESYALRSGATNVKLIPSSVDLKNYPTSKKLSEYCAHGMPVIVWIGSPTTAPYLAIVAASLERLAKKKPFILRLVGISATEINIPGVRTEFSSWSSLKEVELLSKSDIGIMPLSFGPWEMGKCAYKLIQYMASGLPCVASAVGANLNVVVEGETGFLVEDGEAWDAPLEKLLSDAELRLRMGLAGRRRVEHSFSLESNAPYVFLGLSLNEVNQNS
jgi:glycosyltransferase involved in cell wall biosynthesis